LAAFPVTLRAYSLTLVSLTPYVSTTGAMFMASPCRYPSINAAKLFCIESLAPSNCASSACSGTCSSRNGLPRISSKRATTSSGLSASGPPNSIVLRCAAGCRSASAKTDAPGNSELYNKKKFGLRLELWKPIPAVLYEGRFTNRR
jgi:hypothetical protein